MDDLDVGQRNTSTTLYELLESYSKNNINILIYN